MTYDRRIELIHIILERTQGRVYQGPFKGMKVLPKWSWGDGDVGGKVLGLYECELFPYIEQVINSKPDVVLNVGCAEGFYGLGMAFRTNALCALFDVSESAINIARENAYVNGLNKVHFSNDCTVDNYRSYLANATNPFIFMDCEGAEVDILDFNLMPELTKTTVLVESHDCIRHDISYHLISRFKDTHDFKIIPQGTKNPYLDITVDFSDWDKMLLTCEFRPSTMNWLFMTPKTN
jgi:SAM-dependent methyltransferase